MKRFFLILGAVLIALLVMGGDRAFAAKPQSVIALSNGFPSGAHFNLNIHGKSENFEATYPVYEYDNSVFILESGDSTIQYHSEKRSSLVDLKVPDPYAEFFDGDAALVELPYETEGYFVFGRILGKPDNSDTGEASSITFGPPSIINSGNYVEGSGGELVFFGYIAADGTAYEATPEGFLRFDESSSTKGKGKSKAKDITDLFTWSGWIVDEILDLSPEGSSDGVIDEADMQAYNELYELTGTADEFFDLETWLLAMSLLTNEVSGLPLAYYRSDVFIFNVADLVTVEQGVANDGTKLLQIRFYPVETTEFIQE